MVSLGSFSIPDNATTLERLNSRWQQFSHCMELNHLELEDVELCRNVMDEYFENQGMHFKVGMLTVLILLFVIGVLGNALVILCIVIFPTMRSRTNVFLLNLAISDILVFFMCLPFTAYRVIRTSWVFGEMTCRLSPFLQGVSVSVSILSLASMSIKRYLVIKYPMTAKERMSKRTMWLWVTSIWLLSALISSPIIAAHKLTKHEFFWKSSSFFCVEEWTSATYKTIYTMCLFTLLYLAPLVAMAIFYSMLGRTLVSTVKFTRQVTNETHQNSLRAVSRGRVKVSKIMIALLVAFAVCWLPHHVGCIFMDLRQRATGAAAAAANHTVPASNVAAPAKDSYAHRVNVALTTALPIAQLLSYANSAINPLCLLLISSKFKKYARLISTCRCAEDSRAQRARSEQMQMHSLCSRQHQQQLQQQQLQQQQHMVSVVRVADVHDEVDNDEDRIAAPLVHNHSSQ